MQFIAMEHISGWNLYQIWDDLTMDHKKAALSQIAAVLGQLAQLRFTQIGSLWEDFTLGPLLHMRNPANNLNYIVASRPFTSTFNYLVSVIQAEFGHHRASEGENIDFLLFNVRSIHQAYNVQHTSSSSICPPFQLLHVDFDGQNMLFTDPKYMNNDPPQLTGIIDWEHAHPLLHTFFMNTLYSFRTTIAKCPPILRTLSFDHIYFGSCVCSFFEAWSHMWKQRSA